MHNVFPIVVASWVIVGAFLVFQGVYTLVRGRVTLFFVRPTYSRSARGLIGRLGYSFVYLLPGVAAITIFGLMIGRVGIDRARTWVVDNVGMLLGSLLFVTLGLLHLIKAEHMLRWTIRTHPELSQSTTVIVVTRVIGLGLLCLGLGMLAAI